MKNFEFKSAICTSVEQSKRLLELGLKKETADMTLHYERATEDYKLQDIPFSRIMRLREQLNKRPILGRSGDDLYAKDLPAWSLHRLMEIIQNNEKEISYILDREELTIEWFDDGGWKNKFFRHIENNIYDSMISCIEYMLKEGLINPEYLEKQA